MKKLLLCFLSTCTVFSFLQVNKSPIKSLLAEEVSVDYTNKAHQMWQVQDTTKNLLMGNSIYNYYTAEARLFQSIRLKKAKSNYFTLCIEFSEDIAEHTFEQGELHFNIVDDDGGVFLSVNTRLSTLEEINQDIMSNKLYFKAIGNKAFFQINTTTAPEYIIFRGGEYGIANSFNFKMDVNDLEGKVVRSMLYDGKIEDYSYEPSQYGIGKYSTQIYNNGSSFSYVIDYDNLLTLDDILSNITAFDYYGKKELEKVVEEDTYTNAIHENKLGEFSAKISATSDDNIKSYLNLNLQIVDTTAPVISGETNIVISYLDMPSNGAINLNDYVFGLDNHDGKLSLDESCTTYYPTFFTKNVVNISSTDSSGNKAEAKVNITIVDDVYPTIEGPDTIEVYQYEYNSAQDLLQNYTISDGDGSGIKRQTVKNDNYTYNKDKPGSYTVTLVAIDNSGNETTKDITVIVKNTIGPVFFINANSLEITNSSLLSAEQVINKLMLNGSIAEKKYQNVEYITKNYIENYNKIGQYETEIVCYDYQGNRDYYLVTLKVTKDKESNFFSKTWKSIKNFFINIGLFFKDLWNNFKSLFSK